MPNTANSPRCESSPSPSLPPIGADDRNALKAARRKVRELGRCARGIAGEYNLTQLLRDEPLLRGPQLRLLVQGADLVTLQDFERQLETLCVMLQERGEAVRKAQAELTAKAEAEAEAKDADEDAD